LTLIFHITPKNNALAARRTGEYRAESLSSEGFIHFSGIHQVLGVAERFYSGQHGLVMLVIETTKLKAELKYEAPAHPSAGSHRPGAPYPTGTMSGGQAPAALGSVELPKDEDFSRGKRLRYSNDRIDIDSFPHLYGPLNFDAVIAIYDFEPDADGKFSLPSGLNTPLRGQADN
jgi:uncharacterized protein (DUF952 family)